MLGGPDIRDSKGDIHGVRADLVALDWYVKLYCVSARSRVEYVFHCGAAEGHTKQRLGTKVDKGVIP